MWSPVHFLSWLYILFDEQWVTLSQGFMLYILAHSYKNVPYFSSQAMHLILWETQYISIHHHNKLHCLYFRQDGYTHISEAVGADVKKGANVSGKSMQPTDHMSTGAGPWCKIQSVSCVQKKTGTQLLKESCMTLSKILPTINNVSKVFLWLDSQKGPSCMHCGHVIAASLQYLLPAKDRWENPSIVAWQSFWFFCVAFVQVLLLFILGGWCTW